MSFHGDRLFELVPALELTSQFWSSDQVRVNLRSGVRRGIVPRGRVRERLTGSAVEMVEVANRVLVRAATRLAVEAGLPRPSPA